MKAHHVRGANIMGLVVIYMVIVALFLSTPGYADIYMQNPRGSNNRLNERSAVRANNNRIFDSQNNNRGGYNVGDKTDNAFASADAYLQPEQVYNPKDKNATQYQMVFYEGSELPIQWTAQHGCGGRDVNDPHNLNCNMVLQYACDTNDSIVTDPELQVILRDGRDTTSATRPSGYANLASTTNSNADAGRPRHESEASYLSCIKRSRNLGLFLADQNLKGTTALFTRQNNNGNPSGLECPEERDYYPYWRPTMWRDIAYLTSQRYYDGVKGDGTAGSAVEPLDICEMVTTNSQNVKAIPKCALTSDATATAVTQEQCTSPTTNGQWVYHKHDIPAPVCEEAQWSRDNHLGDSRNSQYVNYTWSLPLFDRDNNGNSNDPFNFKALKKYGANQDMVKCTLRVRYNITTDDYHPWLTDYRYNHRAGTSKVDYFPSPIRNNPTVDIGADLQGLKLALNTAQYGRTFQDRSHIFYIKRRPEAFKNYGKMYNLNVRGKRGNIVQVYPGVEYDFVPQTLVLSGLRSPTLPPLVHVQWTGSNRHNNEPDGGDGQTGDAGEGKAGTDRHNMVQTMGEGVNYPLPLDVEVNNGNGVVENMWKYINCYDMEGNLLNNKGENDYTTCPLILLSSGKYRAIDDLNDVGANPVLDALLDNAPASLVGGIVLQFKSIQDAKHFTYICTRNNNFSNRSQKGRLVLLP